MISEQYKQFYGLGGGGGGIANNNGNKTKEQAIMSSLKKVQNEMCAEILSKLQEPIRKRTLSKTPEKNTLESIRKSLNLDSQNHKIHSYTILDSQSKELNGPKTPTSSSSSSYASNFTKTPQGQKLQKISYNLSNRSKSPSQISSEKTRTKILSNPFANEISNQTNFSGQTKYLNSNSIPTSSSPSQKASEDYQSNQLTMTKEQMRLFYEQEKRKNQQQLQDMAHSNQELLKSELDDINKFFSYESDDFTSSSTLPFWEKIRSNQQFDSHLTTCESQGEYQQYKSSTNNSNLSQQLYKPIQQSTSPTNDSPIKSKEEEQQIEQKLDTKQNKPQKSQQSYISFRKNSRSPIPRNSQPRNSKSPISKQTVNNKNLNPSVAKQQEQVAINQNDMRSKQVSFSQDIFVVEKQNIPKSYGIEYNSQNSKIFEQSSKELHRQYEQHLKTNPLDQQQKKEFEELLSLVKKEKQIILNEIKYLTEQRNKYKYFYEEAEESKSKSRQQEQKQQDQDLTKSPAFKKIMNYLDSTSYNTGNFLKIQQNKDSIEHLISTIKNKDEVIHVQKLVINKLLNQLNQKQPN